MPSQDDIVLYLGKEKQGKTRRDKIVYCSKCLQRLSLGNVISDDFSSLSLSFYVFSSVSMGIIHIFVIIIKKDVSSKMQED